MCKSGLDCLMCATQADEMSTLEAESAGELEEMLHPLREALFRKDQGRWRGTPTTSLKRFVPERSKLYHDSELKST